MGSRDVYRGILLLGASRARFMGSGWVTLHSRALYEILYPAFLVAKVCTLDKEVSNIRAFVSCRRFLIAGIL